MQLVFQLDKTVAQKFNCDFSRELGIGIVPYSPLGRGFFGGKGVVETIPANTMMVC